MKTPSGFSFFTSLVSVRLPVDSLSLLFCIQISCVVPLEAAFGLHLRA